jgi:hypothetical protein
LTQFVLARNWVNSITTGEVAQSQSHAGFVISQPCLLDTGENVNAPKWTATRNRQIDMLKMRPLSLETVFSTDVANNSLFL